MARHVGDGHRAVRVQRRGHDADARLDPVLARPDTSEMCERDNEADGSVSAHAEHADVVEEEDARDARLVRGLDEQRPDQHV